MSPAVNTSSAPPTTSQSMPPVAAPSPGSNTAPPQPPNAGNGQGYPPPSPAAPGPPPPQQPPQPPSSQPVMGPPAQMYNKMGQPPNQQPMPPYGQPPQQHGGYPAHPQYPMAHRMPAYGPPGGYPRPMGGGYPQQGYNAGHYPPPPPHQGGWGGPPPGPNPPPGQKGMPPQQGPRHPQQYPPRPPHPQMKGYPPPPGAPNSYNGPSGGPPPSSYNGPGMPNSSPYPGGGGYPPNSYANSNSHTNSAPGGPPSTTTSAPSPNSSSTTIGPDGTPIHDESSQQSTLSQSSDRSDSGGGGGGRQTPKGAGFYPGGSPHGSLPSPAGAGGENSFASSPNWQAGRGSPQVKIPINSHLLLQSSGDKSKAGGKSGETSKAKKPSKTSTSKADTLLKLYDLDDHPERKGFLDRLFGFMEERGTPIVQCPTISKNPLDLFKLYLFTKERGGFMECTKHKTWKDIASQLGIGPSSSGAYTLKKHYGKNLLPYECQFDRGGIDPAPLLAQMETQTKKKSKNTPVQPPPAPSPGSQDSRDSTSGAGSSVSVGQNSQDGNPSGAGPNANYPPHSYNSGYPPTSVPPGDQRISAGSPHQPGSNYPPPPSSYPSAGGPPPPPGAPYPPSRPPGPPGPPGSEQYPGYPPGNYPRPGWPPGGYMPPSNGTTAPPPPTTSDAYNGRGWNSGQPPVSQGGYGSPRYPPPPPSSQSQTPYSQTNYADQYQQKPVGPGAPPGAGVPPGPGAPPGPPPAPVAAPPGPSAPPGPGAPHGAPIPPVPGAPPPPGAVLPPPGSGAPPGAGVPLGPPGGTVPHHQPPTSQSLPPPSSAPGGMNNLGPPLPKPPMHPNRAPSPQLSTGSSGSFEPDKQARPVILRPNSTNTLFSHSSSLSSQTYPNRGPSPNASAPMSAPSTSISSSAPAKGPSPVASSQPFTSVPGASSSIRPPVSTVSSGYPPQRPPHYPGQPMSWQNRYPGPGSGSQQPPASSTWGPSGPMNGPRPPTTWTPESGSSPRPGFGPYSSPSSQGSWGPGAMMGKPGGAVRPPYRPPGALPHQRPGFSSSPRPGFYAGPSLFPPGCVESTPPLMMKRRKLTKLDIRSVDGWKLVMALKSGLLMESTWALDVLNVLLYDDGAFLYFGLGNMPGLMEAIMEHWRSALISMFGITDDLEPITSNVRSLKRKNPQRSNWYQSAKNCEDETEDESKEYDLGAVKNVDKEDKCVVLNGTNFTKKPRFSEEDVQLESKDDTLFVTDSERDWDKLNDGFELNSDHWRLGGGNVTDHIIPPLQAELGLVPFVRMLKEENKNCASAQNSKDIKSEPKEEEMASQNSIDADNENKTEDIVAKLERLTGIVLRDPDAFRKQWQNPNLEDECYIRDEPSLRLISESQENLGRRAVCVSTILRNLSFIPGNEYEFRKSTGFLRIAGQLLLMHHWYPQRSNKQRNFDRSDENNEDDIGMDGDAKLANGNSTSSLNGDDEWWWEFLHTIRENVMVILANIAGCLELNDFDEDIIRPIFNGLLEWSVSSSSYAQDPFPTVGPHSSISPQRLAIETLCKLCLHEANVDLLLTTPPFNRIAKLAKLLAKKLYRYEDQVLREFSINLLYYFSGADSGISRLVATSDQTIGLLLSFIEQAEQNAMVVAQQHGVNALRDNPESMGTSLDMLRRAASTLNNMSQHPDNTSLFSKHEQRILTLVMSQILDQGVASILSHVLFNVGQEKKVVEKSKTEV